MITPLGPDPLRVRLVLNSLIHKWIRHVAELYPSSLGSQGSTYCGVITCALLAGLPILEARAVRGAR